MRGVIDAIYWRLHSAFLRNRREEASKFLSMLEDELAPNQGAISEIGAPHVARFRLIADEVRSGRFGRLHGGYSSPQGQFPFEQPEPSCEEKEFHRTLMTRQARNCLFPLLDWPEAASMSHEHDMAEYGRADFLLRAGRKAAVMEIKMGGAPPSVVSQIDRYRLGAELDMCLGLYDEVEAIVLSESFPSPVAAELARLDVRMVLHSGRADWFGMYNREKEEYPWM